MLSNINTFRFGGNRYNEALWGRTAGRYRHKKWKRKRSNCRTLCWYGL